MPLRLYKYEAFTTRSLENLKAQSIYFGSPSEFNDPYDCAFLPKIKSPSDAEVELIRKNYIEDSNIPSRVFQEFRAIPTESLRKLFLKAGRKALNDAVNDFMVRRGVSCFSSINDDLLMWSHYGGKYKGFCLEFDTSYVPFERIMEVTYSAEIPSIDLAPLLISDNYDQVLSLFTTKAQAWKYEREWRAVHADAGTLYTYPAESLKSVYFGPDISDQALEIICLILQGQNQHVHFWRGRRSETEFKVEFDFFTYTSYIQAKN